MTRHVGAAADGRAATTLRTTGGAADAGAGRETVKRTPGVVAVTAAVEQTKAAGVVETRMALTLRAREDAGEVMTMKKNAEAVAVVEDAAKKEKMMNAKNAENVVAVAIAMATAVNAVAAAMAAATVVAAAMNTAADDRTSKMRV